MTPYPTRSTLPIPKDASHLWTRGFKVSICILASIWFLSTPHAASVPNDEPPAPVVAHSPTSAHLRPVPGTVLSPANIPIQQWLPGHRGVDLNASPGDLIRASAAGIVLFSGVVAGTPVLSIDHGGGLRTTYEPVLSHVKADEHVAQGAVIGALADPTTLPSTARREQGLHWGAIVRNDAGDRYIDPMNLLATRQIHLWL